MPSADVVRRTVRQALAASPACRESCWRAEAENALNEASLSTAELRNLSLDLIQERTAALRDAANAHCAPGCPWYEHVRSLCRALLDEAARVRFDRFENNRALLDSMEPHQREDVQRRLDSSDGVGSPILPHTHPPILHLVKLPYMDPEDPAGLYRYGLFHKADCEGGQPKYMPPLMRSRTTFRR